MNLMSTPRYLRRTFRSAHLSLVYSHERTPEENVRAIQAALRKISGVLPERPSKEMVLASGVEIIDVRDVGVLSLPRRDRDPALVQQEINGCKSLLMEIIRRAAYDWVLYRTSRRLQHKKLAEQAFCWLFQEDTGHEDARERIDSGKHITSFLAICEALGLVPDMIRTHVKGLTPKNVMSVGRPAEYRRKETLPHGPDEQRLALGSEQLEAEWASLENAQEE